jgi:hypothetical protein
MDEWKDQKKTKRIEVRPTQGSRLCNCYQPAENRGKACRSKDSSKTEPLVELDHTRQYNLALAESCIWKLWLTTLVSGNV